MLKKDAVEQDYSSQRVGSFLDFARTELLTLRLRSGLPAVTESSIRIWDCCAASGGKSIMAKDILNDIDLTVSDVRESILINLKKRFQEAGIKNYKSVVRDLSQQSLEALSSGSGEGCDLIIADVPCSGSGTWGRTPEQLSFFQSSSIETYSALQKKIISNTVSKLKQGGYFLYITCSVFKKENEDNVEWMQEELKLQLLKQEVIKGYAVKADTMFAALLKKS